MKYTSSLVNDARGKLGGIVGSKNTSGNFLRRSNVPCDPKTPIQTRTRYLMAMIAQQWRSNARISYSSWKALAIQLPRVNKLGKPYTMSAFQCFMFLNLGLVNQGLAMVLIPPDIALNQFPNILSAYFNIVCTPGNEDIKFNVSAVLPSNCIWILESTGPVSPGVSYPKNFKYFGSLPNSFITGDSVLNLYIAKFGNIPLTGQLVYFRVRVMNAVAGFVSTNVQSYAIGII